jgi:two-component system phosphate regulon sensor histidine kinase PhoR
MKTFFKVFALIFIPVALATFIVFYTVNNLMVEMARKELLNEMKNKWLILTSTAFPFANNEKRHNLIAKISQKTQLRVTIITNEGIVLDDSYLKFNQVAGLESHKTMPEVDHAIFGKDGYSIRYSKITGMEMIFYAKRMDKNLILRIAYPVTYTAHVGAEFSKHSFSIFLLLFLVTGWIAAYLGQKISIPVHNLNYIVESIEEGKNQQSFPRFNNPTMQKIAGLIYRIYNAMLAKHEELKMEQEKLAHTFKILEEGILLIDLEYKIKHFNQKAEEFLGIPLAVGKNLSTDYSDFEVVNFFSDILHSKTSRTWDKQEYKSKIFDIHLKVLPTEKLIALTEITDLHKYDCYKSELIENISHELRTPLATIQVCAETIVDDAEIDEKRKKDFLIKILDHSKRINLIIDDLLILHKLEYTGFRFTITEGADIQKIINDLRTRFLEKYNKQLHFQSDVDSAQILDTHVDSVLSNLIENAFKYSVGTEVSVKIKKQESTLLITVEDQGPAIPLQERKRIFERFYTVSQSRNKNGSGTGLGLPIVKHITRLYHGKVFVTENKRGGNLFKVELLEKD